MADVDEMEAMIASIKLRVTHQDAYEEWEHRTRKDAFVSYPYTCYSAFYNFPIDFCAQ